jgi:hypothetical protein
VAHTYNSSYLGGRDPEDRFEAIPDKGSLDSISTNKPGVMVPTVITAMQEV